MPKTVPVARQVPAFKVPAKMVREGLAQLSLAVLVADF
jgi:hypothetical protein